MRNHFHRSIWILCLSVLCTFGSAFPALANTNATLISSGSFQPGDSFVTLKVNLCALPNTTNSFSQYFLRNDGPGRIFINNVYVQFKNGDRVNIPCQNRNPVYQEFVDLPLTSDCSSTVTIEGRSNSEALLSIYGYSATALVPTER